MKIKLQRILFVIFCLYFTGNSSSIADEVRDIKIVDSHEYSVLVTEYNKDIIFNPKTCKSNELRDNVISPELTTIRILSAMAQSDVDRFSGFLHADNKENKYLSMDQLKALEEWNNVFYNKLVKIDKSITFTDKVAIKYILLDKMSNKASATKYLFLRFTSDGWKLVEPAELDSEVVKNI